MVRSLLLIALVVVAVMGDGFNSKNIDWVDWSRALSVAKTQEKPVLMLVHKTWCGACKQLRKKFEASPEIEALAPHFVMANVEDDDEPTDDKYSPQGSYSPRIMFLGADGRVADIINRGNGDEGHHHFYGSASEVVRGMVNALRALKGIEDIDEL